MPTTSTKKKSKIQGEFSKTNPYTVLIATLKVASIFNQMQNQLKGVLKILFNPYDQTKKQTAILRFYPS